MDKNEQAKQFLRKYRAKMKILFNGKGFCADGDEIADFYQIVTSRQTPKGYRQYSCFRETPIGKPPTEYDVLKSFPKEPPPTDKYQFARENGLEITNEFDEETVVALHSTAMREWRGVRRLFVDIWEKFVELS